MNFVRPVKTAATQPYAEHSVSRFSWSKFILFGTVSGYVPYWSECERAIPEARRRGVKMQEVVTRTVYVSSKVAAYW